MDIEGEGRRPTRGHVLALAARHGLAEKVVVPMIEEVRAAVSDWPTFAARTQVTTASRDRIAAAIATVGADFQA